MRAIGLQVAGRAAVASWRRRCAEAGYVAVTGSEARCPPPLWLIVLERHRSPLERRHQLRRLNAPIILVTEQVQEGVELAKELPMPLLVAQPGVAAGALADLCVMAWCLAAGGSTVAVGNEAGEGYER